MGLRIQNNISAMYAHRNLTVSDNALTKSLERLSSGYRINRAADDAAGLSISQAFRADIASYQAASQNVAEANSLLQVAEGGMDQIGNMLTRLKQLATQAASANAGANLDKINAEGNKLLDEIDRISNVTEYAGAKLLNGSFGVAVDTSASMTVGDGLTTASGMVSGQTYTVSAAAGTDAGTVKLTVTGTVGTTQVTQTIDNIAVPVVSGGTAQVSFSALGLTLTINENLGTAGGDIVGTTATGSVFQVGAKNSTDNQIGVEIGSTTTTALGLDRDQLLSATNAQTMLDTVDAAISNLNATRGGIGAAQNRMGYAAANLSSTIENVQAAESTIRDVDMAGEMTTFTKNQILVQAGTAMLAQANAEPQIVLALLK